MKTTFTLILCVITFSIYAQNSHKIDWIKNIPGNQYTKIYDIECDLENNIYITGTFEGTTDFDLKSGVYNLTENPGLPLGATFLAKYNDQMDLIWCTKLDTTSLITPSIEIDNVGNLVYIDNAGRFRKYSTNNNLISLVCSFKFGVFFIIRSNVSVYFDLPSGLNISNIETMFRL